MTIIKNRSGNTEKILLNLGYVLKETKDEVIIVFPDGVAVIKK